MLKIFLVKGIIVFLIFVHFIFWPGRVKANFTDDFSQDFSKWQLLNGSNSAWEIENGRAKVSLLSRQQITSYAPKDEFWDLGQNYEVNFIFEAANSSDKTFIVGMSEDLRNYYDFHFVNQTLIVEQIGDGSRQQLMILPFHLDFAHQYTVKIVLSDNELSLYMDGQHLFAAPESWFPLNPGGKFAMRGATGNLSPSTTYYDQVEIRAITDTANPTPTLTLSPYPSPSLEAFKQTSVEWANHSYDHLIMGDGSVGRIADWGCALTSAATLLRHYGFASLVNGEELQPASLDRWLRDEEDGYIANGLLNWLAISRLSSILRQNDSVLPALEFSYYADQPDNLRTKLYEEIALGHWSIAQSPGHFFLVTDYDSSRSEFSIFDPYFDRQSISAFDSTINSLRLFHPSYTDLSYLLVVMPNSVNFYLEDSQGQMISDYQLLHEEIHANSAVLGQLYQLLYLKRTEADRVKLVLAKDNDLTEAELASIKLFFYDRAGNLFSQKLADKLPAELNYEEINSLDLILKINPEAIADNALEELKINYASAEELLGERLNQLVADVNQAFNNDQLSFYFFYQINHLVEVVRQNLRLESLINQFMNYHHLPFQLEPDAVE